MKMSAVPPRVDCLCTYTEEQAGVLCCSTNKWSSHASVQSKKAILSERLSEAVQRSFVAKRQVIGLRLETNLDRVERVLHVLTRNACYAAVCNVLECCCSLALSIYKLVWCLWNWIRG